MIECNNNYKCKEDKITYDDITSSNNCIALGDDNCTTCASINEIRKYNSEQFNANPIRVIFDKIGSETENADFWSLLESKCSMQRPETSMQKTPIFHISEPDYNVLLTDKDKIQQRLVYFRKIGEIKDLNASNFVDTLYKIATLPNFATFNSISELKQSMHDILNRDNCSSRMIHDANKLPINIQVFFSLWSISPDSKFTTIANLLDDKPEACLEGIIGQSNRILESDSLIDYGGNKMKKKIVKFTKKNKNLKGKTQKSKRKTQKSKRKTQKSKRKM